MRVALNRRADLQRLVGEGFPDYITKRPGVCDKSGNRFFAVAGDRHKTRGSFALSGGKIDYEYLRGDETVLLRGAANNDIGRSIVSFASHQTIFEDEHVYEALRRILLRCDLNFTDFAADVLTISLEPEIGGSRASVPIYTVGVEFEPVLPSPW